VRSVRCTEIGAKDGAQRVQQFPVNLRGGVRAQVRGQGAQPENGFGVRAFAQQQQRTLLGVNGISSEALGKGGVANENPRDLGAHKLGGALRNPQMNNPPLLWGGRGIHHPNLIRKNARNVGGEVQGHGFGQGDVTGRLVQEFNVQGLEYFRKEGGGACQRKVVEETHSQASLGALEVAERVRGARERGVDGQREQETCQGVALLSALSRVDQGSGLSGSHVIPQVPRVSVKLPHHGDQAAQLGVRVKLPEYFSAADRVKCVFNVHE
jgi:hypothetical protein